MTKNITAEETPARFITRAACANDINFIYSTWLESFRYDSCVGRSHRNSVFFNNYRKVLDRIIALPDTKILVSTLEDDPNFIAGWVCFEPKVLHYIYTRGTLIHSGIAKALYREAFLGETPLTCTHLTSGATALFKRLEPMVHNSFLLYQKGDTQDYGQQKDDSEHRAHNALNIASDS